MSWLLSALSLLGLLASFAANALAASDPASLLAAAPAASATAVPPGLAPVATPTGQALTRTFHDLGSPRNPLRLNGLQAAYTVKLPLSPREVMTDVLLRLETVNSTALLRNRSELSVRVNGRILAQYALDPERTRMSNEVPVPLELLKSGYNEVQIAVVQHYANDCEDPSSPELWTEIDPLRSGITLNFQGVRPNLQPKLSQLHTAFDMRAWAPRRLALIVGTESLSEAQLSAAGTVVQGLALRKGYKPLSVDVFNANTAVAAQAAEGRFGKLNSALVDGRDVLLIGKRGELNRYLDLETNSVMGGPFVGVFAANQGDSVVLVVSGTTDEELMQAARSVADPGFQYSDAAMEMVVKSISFNKAPLLEPRKPTPFQVFGFQTASTRGIKAHPVTLEFRAPADFGARTGEAAKLRLHFSYGAGFRKDSSLTLHLNGTFAVAVPLADAAGGELPRYEVALPAQYIRPGYNTLTFEPVFLTSKDRCDTARDEHMVLTIYEDSTLELPQSAALPAVPSLERFSRGLWPLQDHLRVYLTANDTGTAAAALEALALMAQKNRAPLDLTLSFSPFKDGHMLVVGPYSGLAQAVGNDLSLRKYPWSAEGTQAGILQAAEGKRIITALLARDSHALRAAVDSLGDKNLWPALRGAAAVIDTQEQQLKIEAAPLVAPAAAEPVRDRPFPTVNLSDWRWWAAGAAGGVALLTFAGVAVLRRQAKKRTRPKARRVEPKVGP